MTTTNDTQALLNDLSSAVEHEAARFAKSEASADTDSNRATLRVVSVLMQMGIGTECAIPFLLVGPPGTSKTAIIGQLANRISQLRGTPFASEVWSAPQIQEEDVSGLPVPDLVAGRTRLLPLRIGDKVQEAGAGVLVLDEFGSIDSGKESVYLNLLCGKRLGERILPNSIALGAMMNPPQQASNGRTLSLPASNRFAWFTYNISLSDTADYMRGGPGILRYNDTVLPLPENWTDHLPEMGALVARFIEHEGSMYHLVVPPVSQAGQPFPTPRTWEYVKWVLAALKAVGQSPTSMAGATAVRALVGDVAGAALQKWLMDSKLPSVETDILNSAVDIRSALATIKRVGRSDYVMALMELIAHGAVREHDDRPRRLQRAMDIYVSFLREGNHSDWVMSGLRVLYTTKSRDIRAAVIRTMNNYPPSVIERVVELMGSAGMLDQKLRTRVKADRPA